MQWRGLCLFYRTSILNPISRIDCLIHNNFLKVMGFKYENKPSVKPLTNGITKSYEKPAPINNNFFVKTLI